VLEDKTGQRAVLFRDGGYREEALEGGGPGCLRKEPRSEGVLEDVEGEGRQGVLTRGMGLQGGMNGRYLEMKERR
jgi:hypothetical protein